MTSFRAAFAAVAFVASVGAQTLTLNGQTGPVDLVVGTTAVFHLQGPPGAPALWGFNTNAGPIVYGSTVIPIGDTPELIELLGGAPMPPSGSIVIAIDIPFEPLLDGITLYSVGVFGVPSATDGLEVTNGLAFTFRVRQADAGADAATLVGEAVALDGSGNTDLPPGSVYQWSVTAGPPGAVATLDHFDAQFPVFTTDLPGVYSITLAFRGPQGGQVSTDTALVHVYDVSFTSPVDGSFGTGTFNVAGTATGPAMNAFAVNGVAATLTAGAFNLGMQTPAALGKVVPVTAEITSPSGAKVSKTVTRLVGAGQSISSPALPAAGIRANGLTLDPLEAPLEQALGAIDLSAAITAIPPLLIINQTFGSFTIFSATAQPTGFTYDPFVDVEFAPGTNCGINTSLTFTNLVITFLMTGKIANVPYSETLTITAAQATVVGDIVFVQGSNGLEAQVQNANATLTGFAFSATGVLSGLTQLAAIAAAVQSVVELALEGFMQLLPPIINPLIATLNQATIDLSAQGIPLLVGFPLASLCYDVDGITVGLGLTLAPQGPPATDVPALTHYRSTVGSLPVFGANTPVFGVPYTAAVALNDDAFNVLFASFTTLGALNLDVGTQLGATPLTAGDLDLALPGAGFDAFDPAAAVTVSVRHTTAPSLEMSQLGPVQGGFYLGGLEIGFSVATGGYDAPVMTAGLSANADLAFTVNTTTQTVTLAFANVVSATTVLRNFPGADASASLAALNALLQPLIGQLAAGLSAIPIPSAGGGAGVQEVSISGDNLAIYL